MTILLVMGVSGCGKTTVAAGVAERLGWALLEGDAFHPPANVAKMASGTPLTDEDRWPWLRAIAAEAATHDNAVIACSALKTAYRAILAPDVLVYLQGSKTLIAERLRVRKGHFMPPALLDSQFAALEPPGADENPMVVPIDPPPPELIQTVLARMEENLS
jgi:carbohydrate kinase (thermoresistant glucokinase family)